MWKLRSTHRHSTVHLAHHLWRDVKGERERGKKKILGLQLFFVIFFSFPPAVAFPGKPISIKWSDRKNGRRRRFTSKL